MDVKVNFPNKSNLKENKELDCKIAQLDAILIKRYIDNLEKLYCEGIYTILIHPLQDV